MPTRGVPQGGVGTVVPTYGKDVSRAADQAMFCAAKSQCTTFQNASTNFGRALR